MNRTLISKDIVKSYSKLMKQVIKDLSKCIVIYSEPISIECLNCEYSVTDQKSAGVRRWKPVSSSYTVFSGTNYERTYYESQTDFNRGRCPVCFGRGELTMPSKSYINALVTWQFSRSASSQGNRYQRPAYWPAGLENKHACRIKTDVCNLNLISNAEYFDVDGYKMKLWNDVNLEGLGEIDNILIVYLIDMQENFVPK